MKRLFVYAAFAVVLASCGNAGNSSEDQSLSDTTSPASGATGNGQGTGNDTTGLDVGAVQPIDSSVNARPLSDEPGADRSGVSGNDTTSGTGDQ